MLDPSLRRWCERVRRLGGVAVGDAETAVVNAWITLPQGFPHVKLQFDRRVLIRNYSLAVTVTIVKHRDWFACSALNTWRRRWPHPATGSWSWTRPGDDLVRDVTEILTSVCVLLYGRRAAASRARRAVEAVTGVAS